MVKKIDKIQSSSKNYVSQIKRDYNNPYYLIFFRIKNKTEFLKSFLELIIAFHNHQKFIEDYKRIKDMKLKLMYLVENNLKMIDNLLIELYNKFPIKREELDELLIREGLKETNQSENIKEELEKIKQEKIKEEKEINDLDKLKDELKELEEKLLKIVVDEE